MLHLCILTDENFRPTRPMLDCNTSMSTTGSIYLDGTNVIYFSIIIYFKALSFCYWVTGISSLAGKLKIQLKRKKKNLLKDFITEEKDFRMVYCQYSIPTDVFYVNEITDVIKCFSVFYTTLNRHQLSGNRILWKCCTFPSSYTF